MNDAPEIPRPFREKEPWLLASLVLSLFLPTLLNRTYAFRDLYLLFLPRKRFLAECLAAGELPLVDPTLNAGMSVLTPSNTLFHPSTLLYAGLPLLLAFNLVIVLHHVLAAVSTYALARRLTLSRAASFLSGAAFALSGYFLSTANLTPLLFGLTAYPIAFLAWLRFLQRRRAGDLAATALALALPLLGGAAEATGLLLVLLATMGAVWQAGWRSIARTVASLAFAATLAGVIASIQLVPAVDIVRESSRKAKRSWENFTEWSVSPRRLPELVIPGFLGPVDTLSDEDYWGRKIEDTGFPYILSIYLGAPILVCALFGAFSRAGPLPRRVSLALLGLSAAAVLLSLGRYLPGFQLAWHLPLVATFRFPVKALLLALLPIALLAGAGLDASREGRARALAKALAVAAGGLLLAGLAVAATPLHGVDLASAYFGVPIDGAARARLVASLLTPAGALAAGALALARLPATVGPALLVGVCVVELAASGLRVNAWVPRELLSEPPLARDVRLLVADGGRLFREEDAPGLPLEAPSNQIDWLIRANLEGLRYYSASLYGIPVVLHNDFDGLAPQRIAWLGEKVRSLPWELRLPVLRAAGVRAIVSTTEVPPLPGLRPRGTYRSSLWRIPIGLYELEGEGWARFATTASVEPRPGASLEILTRRPLGEPSVVLSADPRDREVRLAATGAMPCDPARVTVLERSTRRSRIQIDTACAGWLVLSDSWHRGWETRRDGKPVAVVAADVAFTAVPIPAGHHVVDREYGTRSLRKGAAISGAGLLVIAALFVAGRRARVFPGHAPGAPVDSRGA